MPLPSPFKDTDLLDFTFVGDPQLSPDGERVAYVVTTVDEKENLYRSHIAVVPFAGGAPRAFTGGERDTSPRWSPDGRYIAFISTREAKKGENREEGVEGLGGQIYVVPTDGGEARRVTNIRGGVGEFVWSPDSTRIAFVSRIRPSGPEFVDEEPAEAAADAAEKRDERARLFKKYNRTVRVIERIHYRQNGMGYLEDKRAHVFVVDVAAALANARRDPPRPVRVTHGDFDHHGPAWSPDGRRLAVASCHAPDPDQARFNDIWVYEVPEGPGDAAGAAQEPRKLTRSTGFAYGAAWSPDGSTVAYLGHNLEYEWYSDTKLWLVPSDGSAPPRRLAEGFERSFGDESITDMRFGGGDGRPVWSPDGRAIYVSASDRGTTHLYRVDTTSGEVERLTSGDVVLFGQSVRPAAGRFACTLAAPDHPGDVFVGEIPARGLPALSDPLAEGGAPLRRLTEVNRDLLAERIVAVPERFRFRAEGGPEVDGWAIRPRAGAGPDGAAAPKGKVPTLLEIHGGPMAMYTSTFFLEFQLLAARGFGIVYTNPRGSQGYGERFCAGIRLDWGTNDYADIMAGVDEAIRRFDWIDADRLGVLGGSYGGYMTAWIIGHTQRFKAACAMRSVTNCASFFGTSDGGYQWDIVWGGTPWENPENYARQSPITYAGNMRTPTLILHAEEDYRCLMEQDEQLYVALKKQGVEARFVRYPDENHELSRSGQPWHRVHRLRQIVEWFVEKLQPAAAGARASE